MIVIPGRSHKRANPESRNDIERDSGSAPSVHPGMTKEVNQRNEMMRITILFGGTNKERLVSVASAQALHSALPEADLWFWDVDDTVHETASATLLQHSRPFEVPFKTGTPSLGSIEAALDRARAENRLLVLGLHGGTAEDGELQAMCEMRDLPFTGSGSAASH